MENDTERNIAKVKHAIACILPEFFGLCTEYAQVHGAGLTVFCIHSKTDQRSQDGSNCTAYYLKKDNWNELLYAAPNKEAILEQYDPERHVIISVQVPAVAGTSHANMVMLFENELKDGKCVEVRTAV